MTQQQAVHLHFRSHRDPEGRKAWPVAVGVAAAAAEFTAHEIVFCWKEECTVAHSAPTHTKRRPSELASEGRQRRQ